MPRRCGVCGFETGDAICPRCDTILLRGQATCPRCGRLFLGWVARCDGCGTSLGSEPQRSDDEAVRTLAAVPGITEDRARALVARGFRDFSDIVRLALPEHDVRRGLHHTIARRALLADLAPTAQERRPGDRCRVCGARWPVGADRCGTCGSARAAEPPVPALEAKLQAVTEEMVGLAQDEDFRGMPEAVRRELVDAFAGLRPEDVLREECRRQIAAWRAKGFDVGGLEALAAGDLVEFRERSVRLIRAQILKTSDRGTYRCPLCSDPLPAAAEQCGNCGAKFV